MDILDKAKELEMEDRKRAVAEQKRKTKEPAQNVVGGEVLCIDCDKQINAKRLTAKPEAARCIDCQSTYELRER